MKQILLTLLFLLTVASASAQTNPVDGYIITNQNDTVYGTIDYLQTSENCRICHFQATGDSVFKVYYPADIKGFRFNSDGVYYISRTITVKGSTQQVFVEYLIQGGVSLMHYATKKDDYYILIGEDGQEVVLQDDLYNPKDDNAPYRLKERLKQRRVLYSLFEKSPETLDKLNTTPYKSEALSNLVHQYDENFCNDQVCIRYEYDKGKSRNFETRIFVEAGMFFCDYVDYDTGAIPSSNSINVPQKSYYDHSVVGPRVGVGALLHSNRHLPAFYYNIKFGLGYGRMDNVYDSRDVWSNNLWLIEVSLGAEYHFFQKKKSTPWLALGINSVLSHFNGVYGGLGYEFPMGKHKVRVSATYTYTLPLFGDSRDVYRRDHFDATIGLLF